MWSRLQPYVVGAATVCGRGCNRMWSRLQPYVMEVRRGGAAGERSISLGAVPTHCAQHTLGTTLSNARGESTYALRACKYSTLHPTVQASFDESLHEMVYGDGPGLPEPEAFDVASLGELFAEPEPEPER